MQNQSNIEFFIWANQITQWTSDGSLLVYVEHNNTDPLIAIIRTVVW